ncbi:hypothetical protein L6452_39787 [Arctium lappa]|uniref:Uncharacterized protein n=1 Tax=Arctium lappa TaxID=4217 RepID=A0ACB8XTA6_ARCLA|nr:hypothetical protein L6452_39787 [Arctium lappa]
MLFLTQTVAGLIIPYAAMLGDEATNLKDLQLASPRSGGANFSFSSSRPLTHSLTHTTDNSQPFFLQQHEHDAEAAFYRLISTTPPLKKSSKIHSYLFPPSIPTIFIHLQSSHPFNLFIKISKNFIKFDSYFRNSLHQASLYRLFSSGCSLYSHNFVG